MSSDTRFADMTRELMRDIDEYFAEQDETNQPHSQES